jgi:hypothetical protein
MHDVYDNPLISRHASREMATLWGRPAEVQHVAKIVGRAG